MNFLSTHRWVFWMVVVIIILVAVGLVVWHFWAFRQSASAPETSSIAGNAVWVPSQSVPNFFPPTFPSHPGDIMIANINFTKDYQNQSLRATLTNMSLDEAYLFYRNYFASLGWHILNATTSTGYQFAAKNPPTDVTADVSMTPYASTSQVEVFVNMIKGQ